VLLGRCRHHDVRTLGNGGVHAGVGAVDNPVVDLGRIRSAPGGSREKLGRYRILPEAESDPCVPDRSGWRVVHRAKEVDAA
jgi:hypothetical protein